MSKMSRRAHQKPARWGSTARFNPRAFRERVTNYILLTVMALFVLFPLYWMLNTSFKSQAESMWIPPSMFPSNFTVEAYQSIFVLFPMGSYFFNTLKLSTISTIIGVFMSTMSAYGISRFRFPGRGAFLSFLLITQMFPSIMMLIPYYSILARLNLLDSHEGMLILYSVGGVAMCTWLMKGYFDTIPLSLDEAARIDGASAIRIFIQIAMPLALPGLAATIIYGFLSHWNEYQMAMISLKSDRMKTLTVGLASLHSEYRVSWNEVMAAAFVASIPLIILFTFCQKYFIASLTAGAVKQ